jgi:spore germination protein GerM
MNRRAAAIFFVATLFTALVAGTLWWRHRRQRPPPESVEQPAVVSTEEPEETAKAVLYFPGEGGRLYPEEREMALRETVEQRITNLVQELLAGPTENSLFPPLPSEVSLGPVHVTADGLVYVDLDAPPKQTRPPWGSKREMLAVYSLVNTVLLNIPEVDAVVLLWNGQQTTTFAGHLDTSRPLRPNRTLVAERRSPP